MTRTEVYKIVEQKSFELGAIEKHYGMEHSFTFTNGVTIYLRSNSIDVVSVHGFVVLPFDKVGGFETGVSSISFLDNENRTFCRVELF